MKRFTAALVFSFGLLLVSTTRAETSNDPNLNDYPPLTAGLLFTMAGFNTLGAKLAPMVGQATSGPSAYRQLAQQGRRLSVNFRFRPGSADLDNKAKQDARRLAQYLKQPENQQLLVQLVGFSDAEHTTDLAQVLSRLRATQVRLALYDLGVEMASITGYGAHRPITNAGDKNDRVEVWVHNERLQAPLEKTTNRNPAPRSEANEQVASF